MDVVVAILLLVQQPDPSDYLRRQELSLRLGDLAVNGKFDALARETLRELRGRTIEASGFELIWRIVGVRRWEDQLPEFLAAWDKAAAAEAPSPAQALFRARLESLDPKSKAARGLLEAASTRFPRETPLLWHLAKARFEAGERGAAAQALEQMTPVKGWSWDADEYHRMLVTAYAETGRQAAAVEHLRALREERYDAIELAEIALKCALTGEAVRLFRLVVADEPDRVSYRIGLIRALREDGEAAEAVAERRRIIIEGGSVSPLRLEEYVSQLPAGRRIAEIHDTLRDVLLREEGGAVRTLKPLLLAVPADDRPSVLDLWEKTGGDATSWVTLVRIKQAWGQKPEPVLETIEKAEKLFPEDARLLLAKFEPLKDLQRFDAVADAYGKLVRIDPDGKRTGPRPVGALLATLAGEKNLGSALRLGMLALSDAGLDEPSRAPVREAMKPACQNSGPEFFDEIRKLKIAPAPAPVTAAVREQVKRLSDDEFEVRAAAAKEIRKAGLQAIPVLLEHLDDGDAEVRSKAREIIRSIWSD